VLPAIDAPTLLLYGDADRRSPLAVAHDLHAKIPTSRLVVVPGVGHLCNIEADGTFNSEVRQFICSADRRMLDEVPRRLLP
jgi:pimeloyl-ACP methyl ester carboxylesterase